MSLVKNMDNWSDMSKLDLLYKFSIIKYLRYFIIPELFDLSILVIASIKIRGIFIFIIIVVIMMLYQINKISQSFIKEKAGKLIYRQKTSFFRSLRNFDEYTYSDYCIRKIKKVKSFFNYYVINGEIVKRSFIAYMDDDEICIDEKYCTVLKIPKAYHGLDKLRDF